MCEYRILDVPIYNEMVQLSKSIVDEFLLQNFDKKNKLVRKYVDKYYTLSCFGLCGKSTVVIKPNIYDKLGEIVSIMLDSNGFKTDLRTDNDISIEIIYIDSDGGSVEPDFDIHCDNDAYNSKKVQTLILYYNIDCVGGELEIYSNKGIFRGYKLEETIHPNTYDITTRRIVMMSGKTYHRPMNVYKGKRIAIVYNIKKSTNE
jgi:hypothetical protein